MCRHVMSPNEGDLQIYPFTVSCTTIHHHLRLLLLLLLLLRFYSSNHIVLYEYCWTRRDA